MCLCVCVCLGAGGAGGTPPHRSDRGVVRDAMCRGSCPAEVTLRDLVHVEPHDLDPREQQPLVRRVAWASAQPRSVRAAGALWHYAGGWLVGGGRIGRTVNELADADVRMRVRPVDLECVLWGFSTRARVEGGGGRRRPSPGFTAMRLQHCPAAE